MNSINQNQVTNYRRSGVFMDKSHIINQSELQLNDAPKIVWIRVQDAAKKVALFFFLSQEVPDRHSGCVRHSRIFCISLFYNLIIQSRNLHSMTANAFLINYNKLRIANTLCFFRFRKQSNSISFFPLFSFGVYYLIILGVLSCVALVS